MNELEQLLDMILAPQQTPAGSTIDGAAWARLVDAGLTRVGLAEGLGGSGGTVEDACAIAVCCGESGLSVPVTEATLLATAVAARMNLPLPDGLVTVAVPASGSLQVRPRADGVEVSGHIHQVAWGGQASQIFILTPQADDTSMLLTAIPGDFLVADGTNLAGEPRATLSFDTLLPRAQARPADHGLADDLQLLASFGKTCQISGAARRATQLAIDYAQTRRQFGRRIGEQQAIAHTIAEMVAETAALEASVAAGVSALAQAMDAGDPAANAGDRQAAARFTAAAARVQASRTAATVARGAHQVHAAIGIAAEHPLHHLTLRLWAWPYEYGTPRAAAIDLSNMLLARGSLWKLLTDPSGGQERNLELAPRTATTI
jgi:alkylation response protein AidB-like acyl-CoA dehydrogenase